jgi:hypothetical protein
LRLVRGDDEVESCLGAASCEFQADAGGSAGDDGELIGGHGTCPCDEMMTPNHSASISFLSFAVRRIGRYLATIFNFWT